jgi:FKBP-type peptidyl-prolyl cis-trans isomerase
MSRYRTLSVLLALVAGACAPADDDAAAGDAAADGVQEQPADADAVGVTAIADTYAPELNVDPASMTRTESGLYYHDEVVGDGAVADSGSTVVVHYTGWLPDGTKFDSSLDRDEPFEVVVGVGRVIPGWDEGLQGMRVGGQRKLVIPPHLAYGAGGAGSVIPPNATLVFDVRLLEVDDSDEAP